MASSAYQGLSNITFVPPPSGTTLPGSGMQQSASQAVIGHDALVTATLPFQAIGQVLPPIIDAFVEFDGNVP